MGKRLTATLGYADDDFISDRDSIIYSVDASRGFGRIDSKALILSATANGRIDDGPPRLESDGTQAGDFQRQSKDFRLQGILLDAPPPARPVCLYESWSGGSTKSLQSRCDQ